MQEPPRTQLNHDGLLRINLENREDHNNQERDGNNANQDINIVYRNYI